MAYAAAAAADRPGGGGGGGGYCCCWPPACCWTVDGGAPPLLLLLLLVSNELTEKSVDDARAAVYDVSGERWPPVIAAAVCGVSGAPRGDRHLRSACSNRITATPSTPLPFDPATTVDQTPARAFTNVYRE